MRAGKLRHKVVIEKLAESADGAGGVISTWSTHATRRASIEPLSGREFFAAQQIASEVSIRVRLRYVSGVTPKMRVSYTDPDDGVRLLEILNVLDQNEIRRETILMCKEVQD
ncbi:MAG: phage head closure protein [bacterium]|nr:phage head closure protein [bacterium]